MSTPIQLPLALPTIPPLEMSAILNDSCLDRQRILWLVNNSFVQRFPDAEYIPVDADNQKRFVRGVYVWLTELVPADTVILCKAEAIERVQRIVGEISGRFQEAAAFGLWRATSDQSRELTLKTDLSQADAESLVDALREVGLLGITNPEATAAQPITWVAEAEAAK